MKDKIIFIVIAVAAVLVGAAVLVSLSNRQSEIRSASLAATSVPFTRLAEGKKSSVSERVNYIITSAAQMDELWKMTDAVGAPPPVDFKTHAVLAIFAGSEPCMAINVAKIEDADARQVSIVLAKPDGNCADKIKATSPYEIVTVKVTPLPLTHMDTPTTVSCPD